MMHFRVVIALHRRCGARQCAAMTPRYLLPANHRRGSRRDVTAPCAQLCRLLRWVVGRAWLAVCPWTCYLLVMVRESGGGCCWFGAAQCAVTAPAASSVDTVMQHVCCRVRGRRLHCWTRRTCSLLRDCWKRSTVRKMCARSRVSAHGGRVVNGGSSLGRSRRSRANWMRASAWDCGKASSRAVKT